MQGAVVMLMALSGLGCHNKGCEAFPTPRTTGYASAQTYANMSANPLSPASYSSHDTSEACSGHSARGVLRSTLWSFVIGRDPDVATVRDIEASVAPGDYPFQRAAPMSGR